MCTTWTLIQTLLGFRAESTNSLSQQQNPLLPKCVCHIDAGWLPRRRFPWQQSSRGCRVQGGETGGAQRREEVGRRGWKGRGRHREAAGHENPCNKPFGAWETLASGVSNTGWGGPGDPFKRPLGQKKGGSWERGIQPASSPKRSLFPGGGQLVGSESSNLRCGKPQRAGKAMSFGSPSAPDGSKI